MSSEKTIIYDDNCPLCCWYTNAFVQTGLLSPDGRQSFTDTNLVDLPLFDLERSKDEIPLLDHQGGATLYGIDSLLYLLGQRWRWIPKVAKWPPIDWSLRKFYKLISYNRRVIVAKPTPEGAFDCSPRFNYFYRYFYLLLAFTAGIGGLVLYHQLGRHAWLLTLAMVLIFSFSLLPLFSISEKQKRLHHLGIVFTPWIPCGALLALAAIPMLEIPFITLAIALGGWMWYQRTTLSVSISR